jgi:hypothetical protein
MYKKGAALRKKITLFTIDSISILELAQIKVKYAKDICTFWSMA